MKNIILTIPSYLILVFLSGRLQVSAKPQDRYLSQIRDTFHFKSDKIHFDFGEAMANILPGALRSYHYTDTVPVQNSPKRIGYSYLDNPQYFYRIEFFAIEKAQKNIVMLGNSLTEFGQWDRILERADVANRGIGSDITEGYINRMNYVFNLEPKICFIEGGVNDLGRKVHQDTIIKNLAILIDTLMSEGIIPVLNTVTYLADNYTAHDPKAFNGRVKSLNRAIRILAKQKKVKLIDLNPKISDGSSLIKKYAIDDGIHYTKETYSLWGKEILRILGRLNLNSQ